MNLIQTLPLWPATVASVALFLALGFALFRFSREDILADAPDRAAWRDWRYWGLGLIALQLTLYWIFS